MLTALLTVLLSALLLAVLTALLTVLLPALLAALPHASLLSDSNDADDEDAEVTGEDQLIVAAMKTSEGVDYKVQWPGLSLTECMKWPVEVIAKLCTLN